MAQAQVFVSYSRHDQACIAPIVKLLRVGSDPNLVFFDADSIDAGEDWRREIANAINAAQYLVLFWCQHSVESVEVKGEYSAALDAQKNVVPVLLDQTPLPSELARFQWIDMSFMALGSHLRGKQIVREGAGDLVVPVPSRPTANATAFVRRLDSFAQESIALYVGNALSWLVSQAPPA